MATTTLGGAPVSLAGQFPSAGQKAADFQLTTTDLRDVGLAEWQGKRKVLNIVPSLDTPTCQVSTRRFNTEASVMKNAVVLVISADLPFAMKRFCETEGLQNVHSLSTFRSPEFASNYGVQIKDSVLRGLTARAVVVLDENNKILHSQLVGDIKDEPDYAGALKALV